MILSLHEIARALRGQVAGFQVVAPGPGHSTRDRSLSIRLSDTSPDGFIVHSHAGDDWRHCRDHVADALGLPSDRWREQRDLDPVEVDRRRKVRQRTKRDAEAKAAWLRRRAIEIWQDGRDPVGTIVEKYLNSRGLALPPSVADNVLRYHRFCPWLDGRVPAMVAAMRDIRTGEIRAIHRTALTPDGAKVGRKMLASAAGTAVMLDPMEGGEAGLAIGEGIESCMAARQLGIGPAWALASTAGIAAFPVLPNIEALTLLVENDANSASDRACTIAATRWHEADRAVDFVRPPRPFKDLNDSLMGGSSI